MLLSKLKNNLHVGIVGTLAPWRFQEEEGEGKRRDILSN